MDITVTFPSGAVRRFPAGTQAGEILSDREFAAPPSPIVAVLANNALSSLSYPIDINCPPNSNRPIE